MYQFPFQFFKRSSRFYAVLFVCAGIAPWVNGQSTQPASKIVYRLETRQNPPQRLHVMTVDLTNPAVRVVVRPGGPDPDGEGRWETTLETTSAIVTRDGLHAAINGGPFETELPTDPAERGIPYVRGRNARPSGLTLTDGKPWSDRFGQTSASLIVLADGTVQITTSKLRPPRGAVQMVSGFQQIVLNRKNIAPVKDDLAPRTAVGVDFGSKKLMFLVVDGRRPDEAAGMTDHEVADEMIRLGCHNALMLDGGGSSTMVLRNDLSVQPHVVNTPSDGSQFFLPISVERPVANVIGIRLLPPTTQPVR